MAETKPEAVPFTDAHEKMGYWRLYIFSVDHKVIGKQYLFLGLFMGFVGVGLSFIFRWQLAWPGTAVPIWGKVTAPQYYEVVTMHGTTMVFFVAMPVLLGAFGNFLIPLMVGARDMAFPRLNMASFWTIFVGTVLLLASFFVPGGASRAGWTNYVPLSDGAKLHTRNLLGRKPLAARRSDRLRFSPDGRYQLPHHSDRDARTGDDDLANADAGVGGTGGERVVHAERGTAYRRRGDAAVRSDGGHGFLPTGKGRRSAALAAPVLVLRPSGGVRGGGAGTRYRDGDPAGIQPQADFWLSHDCVVPDCGRNR